MWVQCLVRECDSYRPAHVTHITQHGCKPSRLAREIDRQRRHIAHSNPQHLATAPRHAAGQQKKSSSQSVAQKSRFGAFNSVASSKANDLLGNIVPEVYPSTRSGLVSGSSSPRPTPVRNGFHGKAGVMHFDGLSVETTPAAYVSTVAPLAVLYPTEQSDVISI